jgi:hypothetical protein
MSEHMLFAGYSDGYRGRFNHALDSVIYRRGHAVGVSHCIHQLAEVRRVRPMFRLYARQALRPWTMADLLQSHGFLADPGIHAIEEVADADPGL